MKNLLSSIAYPLLMMCLINNCQKLTVPQQNTPNPGENPVLTRSTSDALPHFESATCWFQLPDDVHVTCGFVNVPEDHTQSMTEKNTIRLAVAIFHSKSNTPQPDPVVYHVGGPGGHMVGIVPYIYNKVIEPFLETRNLILFDPRGTGFSQPALKCNEREEPGDCIRRLFAEGHDLYTYSSLSMAKDMQVLRTALGYDRWNLFGESYGTHVAQVTLREAPKGLRSVIIDSVMPIVIPELPNGSSTFDIALQRLFQSCEADSSCKSAYPDLSGKLQNAVQHLDTRPVTLRTSCYGQETSTMLTGDRLTSMVFESLYETELIASLPYAITAAADGSGYSFWNKVLCWEVVIDDLLTEGAHWAIQCSDGRMDNVCEEWPIVVEKNPVASDIPVLILNGEFDPVTPLEFGHNVAQGFSRSYVFDFRGMGHWINGTGHPCQSAIIQDFLNDPSHSPDASCISTMEKPAFILEP